MSRPKCVEKFLANDVPTPDERTQIRLYIELLESKLPPKPMTDLEKRAEAWANNSNRSACEYYYQELAGFAEKESLDRAIEELEKMVREIRADDEDKKSLGVNDLADGYLNAILHIQNRIAELKAQKGVEG